MLLHSRAPSAGEAFAPDPMQLGEAEPRQYRTQSEREIVEYPLSIDPYGASAWTHHCLQRGTSAPDSKIVRRLLRLRQNASVFAQGCADFPSDSSDRNHSFTPDPRRASPSLRPGLSFRYTQPSLTKARRDDRNGSTAWTARLRNRVLGEQFLGLMVLFVVSLLGIMRPAIGQ